MEDDIFDLHSKNTGMLDIDSDFEVKNRRELAEAYTPGVSNISKVIAKDPNLKNRYTMSGKLIAVITDGSAVLGLGNIGPAAGLPVVEGKALLYKELADVDAIPLAVNQLTASEIAETIANMSKSFAGIHLEDIAAPKCFAAEEKLKELVKVPVYHDDQEGTAIVVLAGLINATKVVHKNLRDLKIVINGVGASGIATGKLLQSIGIKNITLVDKYGVVHPTDDNYNSYQQDLAAKVISSEGVTLDDVIDSQDAFIGLSDGHLLSASQVQRMAENPIIFALANPVPEISPSEAKQGGAAVIATGSSEYPNQVNNILAFPGLFKGLLGSEIKEVDSGLQLNVAKAISSLVKEPTAQKIIPSVFDDGVVQTVAQSVVQYI